MNPASGKALSVDCTTRQLALRTKDPLDKRRRWTKEEVSAGSSRNYILSICPTPDQVEKHQLKDGNEAPWALTWDNSSKSNACKQRTRTQVYSNHRQNWSQWKINADQTIETVKCSGKVLTIQGSEMHIANKSSQQPAQQWTFVSFFCLKCLSWFEENLNASTLTLPCYFCCTNICYTCLAPTGASTPITLTIGTSDRSHICVGNPLHSVHPANPLN